MSLTPCVAERYCRCGVHLQIEYATEGKNSAIVQMFDEMHDGPDCGPVTPQAAAIARSRMSRRELHRRRTPTADHTGRKGQPMLSEDEKPLPRDTYEMLFPDRTGIRRDVINGAMRALTIPFGTRVRARDAWVEKTDDGIVQLRLLCQLGGWNRATYQDSITVLRGLPGYIADADETFNQSYASFVYLLPETITGADRKEICAKAEPVRDLADEAAKAKKQFAAMGAE